MNCTTTRGELQHNYREVEVSLVTTSLTYLAHEAVVSAVEIFPLPRRPGLKKAVRHVTHVARLDFPPGRVVTFLRSKHGLGFGRKKTTCLSRHASSRPHRHEGRDLEAASGEIECAELQRLCDLPVRTIIGGILRRMQPRCRPRVTS